MITQTIQDKLKTIKYPGFSRDIVSFGLVRDINFNEGNAKISLSLTTNDASLPQTLKKSVEAALASIAEIKNLDVSIAVTSADEAKKRNMGKPNRIPGVKHVIAVASGKGGVGKSTLTVNLAAALDNILRAEGKQRSVAVMDCDIYGPSVPLMLGMNTRPEVDGDKIVPVENMGIQAMSMGFLIDEDAPVIWRGPMIIKAIQQFIKDVKWEDIEILVVDLPPGTGDAQLSLVQNLAIDGSVVITTPQAAAVNVARRGATMFHKVDVPIFGIVENMSYFLDPASGQKQLIFGEGGGAEATKDLHTDFLGQIPLDTTIRVGSDRGIPIVKSHPESVAAKEYTKIANSILEKLKSQDGAEE